MYNILSNSVRCITFSEIDRTTQNLCVYKNLIKRVVTSGCCVLYIEPIKM